MLTAATHTIRLQRIEATLNGPESDGFALQNRLSAWCRDRLPQVLDQALERYAPAEGNLVIEFLDVDVGELSLEHLEQEFPECVRRAVENAVRDKLVAVSDTAGIPSGSAAAVLKSNAQATWDAFLYFIKTGRLPWAFRLLPGETLEHQVRASWATGSNSRNLWPELRLELTASVVRSRLAGQFRPAFLHELAERTAPEPAAAARRVLAALRPCFTPEAFDFVERIVWVTALAREAGVGVLRLDGVQAVADGIPEMLRQVLAGSFLEAQRQRPVLVSEIRAAIGRSVAEPWVAAVLDAALSAPLPGPDASSERAPGDDLSPEGMLLDHAGLVLLHPFLPQFFRALHVADDTTLTQPDRALHLLHFLATGADEAPEHAQTFAKILCGIPLGQPVDAHIRLTDAEREEAINLLQTVIRYWEALKETSPDGLRAAFLCRPGKLIPSSDGGWMLQMEKQTHDILLQQLPWGIGMVQLPWMPALLRVEWAE